MTTTTTTTTIQTPDWRSIAPLHHSSVRPEPSFSTVRKAAPPVSSKNDEDDDCENSLIDDTLLHGCDLTILQQSSCPTCFLHMPDCDVSVVWNRLVSFLQSNNIPFSGTTQTIPHGIFLTCQTVTRTRFQLHLLEGHDNDHPTTTLHLQRLSGCPIHAQKVRRRLFAALTQQQQQPPPPPQRPSLAKQQHWSTLQERQ